MRFRKSILMFLFINIMMLSSCVGYSDQEVILTTDFVSEIMISESKYMIVSSSLSNDEFIFESSDESIVTVSEDGLVLGISLGEAVITVTSTSGKVINHVINVIPVSLVESIRFDLEEKDTYYAGVTYNYQIKYFPENALNKNIRFSLNDPNVIIDEINQTVTFIRAGAASIFVYLEDGWLIQSKVDIDVIYEKNSKIYDLLFIGNSLTRYTYNIPMMVKQMIENDGSIVYIEHSTSFQYLDEHAFNVERLLNNNLYTHVILQEKSDGLITDFNRFKQSVLNYNQLIKTNGAQTVLYQTWAYNYPDDLLKEAMHETISEGYKAVSLETQSLISLVGDAFMEVMLSHPEINLYADLNHPSIYGAYLSALVHYKTITGNDASNAKYKPIEISIEIEMILKNVVDKVII